jgi:hypothetical protein
MSIKRGPVIILAAVLACLTACIPSAEIKEAKLYESNLATMVGGDMETVSAKVCNEWKFGLTDSWKWENPSVETVLKDNHRLVGFSRKEASEVFAAAGKYELRIFSKMIAQDVTKTGNIDQYGKSFGEEGTTHASERYSFIRAVFRDGKLVHYRVWASKD